MAAKKDGYTDKLVRLPDEFWVALESDAQRCKRTMPKHWFDDLPHTHVAIDDAIEQGAMFINMMRETRGMEPIKGIPNRA